MVLYDEMIERMKQLKDGETLVAIAEREDELGHFLVIGNDVANHVWAVTDNELETLYKLLHKRYGKV